MAKDSEVKLYGTVEFEKAVKVVLDQNWEEVIKDLKSVQREAKKVTQAIKELDVIKESSKKSNNHLEDLVLSAGALGFRLQATDDLTRGVGKTKILMELAIKHDMLLLVPFGNTVDYLKEQYFFNRAVTVKKAKDLYSISNMYSGFLVDDMVTDEQVQEFARFSGLEFKGGFNISPYYLRLRKED